MADVRSSFAEKFKDIVDNAEKENPRLTYLRSLAQNLAIGLRYAETNDPRRLIGLEAYLVLIDEVNKSYGAYRDLPIVGSIWTYLFGDRRLEVKEALKPVHALAIEPPEMTMAKSQLLVATTLDSEAKTLAIVKSVASILTRGTTKDNSYNTLLLLSLLKMTPGFQNNMELHDVDFENIKLMTLVYLQEIANNEVKINQQQLILDGINAQIVEKEKELKRKTDAVHGLNNKIEVLERDENKRIAYIEQLKREELRLELNVRELNQKNLLQQKKLEELEKQRNREMAKLMVYGVKITQLELELKSIKSDLASAKENLTELELSKENCLKDVEALNTEIAEKTASLADINLDIDHAHRNHMQAKILHEAECAQMERQQELLRQALEEVKSEKLLKEAEVAAEKNALEIISQKKANEEAELNKVEQAYRILVCKDFEAIKLVTSLGPDGVKAIEDYSHEAMQTYDKEQREIIKRALFEMQTKATGLLQKFEGRPLQDTVKVGDVCQTNARKAQRGHQAALNADARVKEEISGEKSVVTVGTVSNVVKNSDLNRVLSQRFAKPSPQAEAIGQSGNEYKRATQSPKWVQNDKGEYVAAESLTAVKAEDMKKPEIKASVPKTYVPFVSTVETTSIDVASSRASLASSSLFAQRNAQPKMSTPATNVMPVNPPKLG